MSNIDHKWPVVYPTAMVSRMLPSHLVKALQETALLDTRSQVAESPLRTRALDALTERIKMAYPQFFQKRSVTAQYTGSK